MPVDAIRQQCEGLGLTGESLLIAVSGGIDSVVLLHAALELAREKSFALAVGHVNHGLRGDDSDADQAFVAALAARCGVPLWVRAVDPPGLRTGVSSRERPTLQEAARALRYRALRAMAAEAGCARIATAHTLDDQAETVLLRLLRGSGPDGLGGIPERSPDGVVVRPLLRVSRARIREFAVGRRIAWREDASNESTGYARNRLRKHWMPGLAADFNPQLLMAIGDLAEAQRRDSEWIDERVEQQAAAQFREESGWLLADPSAWKALPEALARRLARWALRRCGVGRDTSRIHLERMLAFLREGRSGAVLELPGGVRMTRERDGVRLGPLRRPDEPGSDGDPRSGWGGYSAC